MTLDKAPYSTPKPAHFRNYSPDLTLMRFRVMKEQNAHEYAHDFKRLHHPPWLHQLYLHWRELFQEPFRGFTSDGIIKQNLYRLRDEGVPIYEITDAAIEFQAVLDGSQKEALQYHIDSPEWRSWSNPEILLSNKGLRLNELPHKQCHLAMKILEASLSAEGYQKAVSAMEINHFLGELVEAPKVLNRHSYNLVFFGRPSTERPWGFSLYGHHLCLNLFFYRQQVIVAPWFTGAEPNEIDEGPLRGTTILEREAELGLRLMQSLPEGQRGKAQMYKEMQGPTLPVGRWNRDDQRHLCGAYQDNRVVPYEGIPYRELSPKEKDLVVEILDEYLQYLPVQARKMKLADIADHYEETYFCWIGGYMEDDAFYYRIQSPVIVIELDHHSGVFLSNENPAKFHIHTILRYPNGGDYGYALRSLIPSIE